MSSKIAAFGAMLQRKLSRDGAAEDGIQDQRQFSSSAVTMNEDKFDGKESVNVDQHFLPTMQSNSASRERGRDLVSTGRGGIGNIHRSQSRDGGSLTQEQFAQIKRGREAAPADSPTRHFGRGGLGNSVDRAHPRDSPIDTEQTKYEQAIRDHRAEEAPHHIVSGRGGLGNIAPRSRSREAELEAHNRSQSRGRASGRSAAGNMIIDGIAEEDERVKYLQTHEHKDGIQSTGRGGLANLTSRSHPSVEPSPVRHEGFSGRAGAGNFVSRSASRGRHDEGHSSEPVTEQHHHGIGKIMDRMKEKVHRDKHDG